MEPLRVLGFWGMERAIDCYCLGLWLRSSLGGQITGLNPAATNFFHGVCSFKHFKGQHIQKKNCTKWAKLQPSGPRHCFG